MTQSQSQFSEAQVAMAVEVGQIIARGGRYGSNAKFAAAVGLSKTMVGNFRGGNRDSWPVADSDIWSKLRVFLDTESRVGGASATLRECLPLAVTERVRSAIEWAHAHADVALVYGLSGGGKTYAAQAYARESARAYVVTMSPQMDTARKMLARVHFEVCGVAAPARSDAIEDAVVAELRRERAVLIIDEAHFLPQACLDVLRCLHDRASEDQCVGLVLLGNTPIVDNLLRRAAAAQLVGRIGEIVCVDSVAAVDARALGVAAGGVGDKFGVACARIARELGGLRRLAKLLRVAMRAAGGEALTVELLGDVVEARGRLDGRGRL